MMGKIKKRRRMMRMMRKMTNQTKMLGKEIEMVMVMMMVVIRVVGPRGTNTHWHCMSILGVTWNGGENIVDLQGVHMDHGLLIGGILHGEGE